MIGVASDWCCLNSLFSCLKMHFIYLKKKFSSLKSNFSCLKLDFSCLNLLLKRCRIAQIKAKACSRHVHLQGGGHSRPSKGRIRKQRKTIGVAGITAGLGYGLADDMVKQGQVVWYVKRRKSVVVNAKTRRKVGANGV